MLLAALRKIAVVLLGREYLLVAIREEDIREGRIGELLEIDRRKIHRDARLDAIRLKLLEHAENGEVALGRGLGKPIGAVRPLPVMQYVGKMRVEDKSKGAEQSVWL